MLRGKRPPAPAKIQHLPERPDWDCRVCTHPWPCANAKAALLEEFRLWPTLIRVYMDAQLQDASRDLTAHGQLPPPDLFERFLSWTRRRFDRPLPSLPR